jgi:hypothetical protein
MLILFNYNKNKSIRIKIIHVERFNYKGNALGNEQLISNQKQKSLNTLLPSKK